MFSVCLFISHKLRRKIYQLMHLFVDIGLICKLGGSSICRPPQLTAAWEDAVILTTFHHVKLGCLDWIRSDLL